MIEILGVLAVIGMVTLSISKLVSSIYDKYKTSRISQQIVDLKKAVSNRYVANGDYTVINVADIISDRIAPHDMIDGAKVMHAYNGEVTFSGTKDTYLIKFDKLPDRICLELALMNWQFHGDSDLYRIKINDTEFNWPVLAGEGSKEMPVALTDASAACAKGDANEITWTFR